MSGITFACGDEGEENKVTGTPVATLWSETNDSYHDVGTARGVISELRMRANDLTISRGKSPAMLSQIAGIDALCYSSG